jgi:hypothetical protein
MTAKKILVISPAGQVYDHDNVKWYDFPKERIVSEYFNIGDMIVYDSTLKLLDYENVSDLKIINPTPEDIESYRSADYAIVRASNFIHNEMNWHRAVEVLEQLDIPVFAIGVGAQAPSSTDYRLTGTNLRFWQVVSERSTVIGVRGCFTADLLYKNGIKNVEIVGCPSLFRTRNRNLQISIKDKDIKRMAFSIRREVDGKYASDVEKYLRIQRQFLLNAASEFDTTVTIHGEPEEKSFFYNDADTIDRARATLIHETWFSEDYIERMEKLYRNKLFFFLAVKDYDNFIKTQDFALGYRVHGVLPAIANGVPGFLVKYDSRSTELADTLALPSMVVDDTTDLNVRSLIEKVSFDEFNKLYPVKYDKMKFVLDANKIPHRL